jgi:hypothetical protein
VSRIGESGRYFPKRKPLALAAATGELVSQLDYFRPVFGIAAAAANLLAGLGTLAIARRFHLRDERRLLKLRDGPEDLADEHSGRMSSAKKCGALLATSATPRPFR